MTRIALPQVFLDRPIAHRGYHDVAAGRPENSLIAARAAIAAGYGIELDIQPSRDGVAMVFHDYDMARLTGRAGRISDYTAAELGRIALLGADEPVPTFAAFLAEIAGRAPLLVEIKDQDGAMGPNTGALEAAVARDLAGYAGPVALMSFNPHSVAALARVAADLPRGITSWSWDSDDPDHPVDPELAARLREIPDYEATGSSFVSHQWQDLARPRIREIADQGGAILCWTIRSPAAEAEARKIARNITFEGYPA